MSGVPAKRAGDEPGDGVGLLVWVQLAVGQPRVVIDHGVGVLVPAASFSISAAASAIAGDGVAGTYEPCVALRIHVQQVARARPLVAPSRRAGRPVRS